MPTFNDIVWTNERIFMIDFGRAKTGSAHRRFPDVDTCGYRDDAFVDEHGAIVSAMVGQRKVNVRFFRSEISTSAKLFAVSQDPSIVKITSPAGTGQLSAKVAQNIEFSALAAGRTMIDIRYNWTDGPVLGRLYVQVYARIRIPMRAHLLTVNGLGQPNNFLSQVCATRAQRVARFKEFVSKASESWISHGVVLAVAEVVDTVWGVAQIPSGVQNPSLMETLTAGMTSPNRSAVSINVFVVPSIAAPVTGIGVSRAMAITMGLVAPAAPPPPPAVQHFGSGLYLHSASAATPQTIEHEMGHIMSLCALPNQGHSTGDLASGVHTRDDLISRRRLMYPNVGLNNAAPNNWRHDTGYGDHKAGSLVTYRRLPVAQDITFEESRRARDAATAPGFFAP